MAESDMDRNPRLDQPHEPLEILRAEDWDSSAADFWESEAWKEFCRLSFSSDRRTESHTEQSRPHSRESFESLIEAYLNNDPNKEVDDECLSASALLQLIGEEEVRDIVGTSSLETNTTRDSTESIAIYLDDDSPSRFVETEDKARKPDTLDITPLERIRREISAASPGLELEDGEVLEEVGTNHGVASIAAGPLHDLIDDLIAVKKLLTSRQNTSVEEIRSAGPDARGSPQVDHGLIRLLGQLARHQDRSAPTVALPQVLTNPVIASLWIRERMQDKWQQKYTTAKTQSGGSTKQDRQEHLDSREKRRLARKVFDECARESLTEVKQALNQSLFPALDEIKQLKILYDATRHILLQDGCTIAELAELLDRQWTNLQRVMSLEQPLIDDQTQALSSLLDMAHRTSCALETRVNRLSAKDIRDPEERQRVRDRRLGQPEAWGYLSKAWQDLQLLRHQAQTIIAGLETVEVGLSRLAGAAANVYDLGQECVVASADQARHWPENPSR